MSIHSNPSLKPISENHKNSLQTAVASKNFHIAKRRFVSEIDKGIEIRFIGNTPHYFSLMMGMPNFIHLKLGWIDGGFCNGKSGN